MLSNQNNKEENLKCGIYLRVSTNEQAKYGYGLDMQQRNCEAMAKAKGWTVVKIYSDRGYSGSLYPVNRPALKQMIIDAREKRIEAVIFYSLDRLARTAKLITETISYLDALEIKIVSNQESIDTSTDVGLFLITIFSALAELERKSINRRLADGAKERQKKDGEIGGNLPYGYIRLNNKIDINEEHSKIVKYIYDERLKGTSLNDISSHLNVENISSPGNSVWSRHSLSKILLKKDIYLGGPRNGSQVCWPAILPEEYKDIIFVKKRKKKIKEIEKNKEKVFKKKIDKIDMQIFDF